VKVVLDTNLLIGALISRTSLGYALYRHWRTGRLTLLTSEAQLAELRRVTREAKLRVVVPGHQVGALINLMRRQAIIVTPRSIPKLSPDPDDDVILAIALEGKADYLASLNMDHVVKLEKVGKTRILHARDLLERLS
jgi:uncharacterized protein